MHRFALLAMLASCGASGVPIGGTCSQKATCEDGATCDFTDPGGPICIDAEGDLDGDGIPNGKDFCNHAPGGEFDEDGDGIGDDCDPCPIAPPPAIPDSDHDGVDSPCDPDPTTDGDQIVAFDGFNRGLPANWTATAGWTIVDGEAIAMPADPTVDEKLLAPLPLVSQHVALLVGYTIDGVEAQATSPFSGVIVIDQRPAGGSEVRCGGARAGAADRVLVDGDVATGSDPFVSSLFDTTNHYRLALQIDNAVAGCAIIADQETGAAQANTSGEAVNTGGLLVRGASVRFQYLLAIQRTATPTP